MQLHAFYFQLSWLAAGLIRPRIINNSMEEGGKDIGL